MIKEDRSIQRRWDGTAFEPDPYLWVKLEREKPEEICHKALVNYDHEKGFLLSFLNQTFKILPTKRSIIPLYRHAPKIKSFELDLVILIYLLRAKAIDIRGKIVNEKQIPGGETFFRGPHSLNTRPMEEIFGEDREAFLSAGKRLNGEMRKLGDASICLPVFPRVPVTLILWEKDDEFPAEIKVGFDSTISSHLPLDIIWAMINVISKWMTLSV
ncbi:MAG: hypothetical protein DRG66_00010 [Deltaproteobacteria bacterium]|nr:MAG: hypothetical protein DRG66_00010 [Deltaproteobacteria bacterium]